MKTSFLTWLEVHLVQKALKDIYVLFVLIRVRKKSEFRGQISEHLVQKRSHFLFDTAS